MKMKYCIKSGELQKTTLQEILFRYRYVGAVMIVLLLVVSATIVVFMDDLFHPVEPMRNDSNLYSTTPATPIPGNSTRTTYIPDLSTPTIPISVNSTPAAFIPDLSTPSIPISVNSTPAAFIADLSTPSIPISVNSTPAAFIPDLSTPSIPISVNSTPATFIPDLSTPSIPISVNSTPAAFIPDVATSTVSVPVDPSPTTSDPELVCKSALEKAEITTDGCGCLPGVNQEPTCEPDDDRDFLMVVQDVGAVRPDTPLQNSESIEKYLKGHYYNKTTVPIDIDCSTKKLYSSKIKENSEITKMLYDGSHAETFLSDVGIPEDISIDWVSQNLFWIDSDNKKIVVASLEKKLRAVIINDGLNDPKHIVVHPGRGKIFWSDWNNGTAKIEWANEDGSERKIFLDDEKFLKYPHSLTIDWAKDELCWIDAGFEKLICQKIEKGVFREIAEGMSYPYDLAVSADHHYWTEWKSKKIVVMERNECRIAVAIPPESSEKLYGIVAVPKECPEFSNACAKDNGQCSGDQLCLPIGHDNRTCMAES